MKKLQLWMRIVGAFYVLQFLIMAFIKAPIKTLAPDGTTSLAESGDRLAMFLVDTWIIFGVEVGVLGVALLLASHSAEKAKSLVWTIIAIEFFKGPVCDVYMISRGYEPMTFIIWIVIHAVIIGTGIVALRAGTNRQINPKI